MRIVLLLSLLSSLPAAAQTGVLIGTVTQRPDGGPAVDVVVTARGPALNGVRSVVTDAGGNYRLAGMPPGIYALTFEKVGYGSAERADVVLRMDRTVRTNLGLVPEGVAGEEHAAAQPPIRFDEVTTCNPLPLGPDGVPLLFREAARAVQVPVLGPAHLRPFRSLLPLVPRAGTRAVELPADGESAVGRETSQRGSAPDPAENGYLVECGCGFGDDCSMWFGESRSQSPGSTAFLWSRALALLSEDPAGYRISTEHWTWQVRPQHLE